MYAIVNIETGCYLAGTLYKGGYVRSDYSKAKMLTYLTLKDAMADYNMKNCKEPCYVVHLRPVSYDKVYPITGKHKYRTDILPYEDPASYFEDGYHDEG